VISAFEAFEDPAATLFPGSFSLRVSLKVGDAPIQLGPSFGQAGDCGAARLAAARMPALDRSLISSS
jgi:hypothetical protein